MLVGFKGWAWGHVSSPEAVLLSLGAVAHLSGGILMERKVNSSTDSTGSVKKSLFLISVTDSTLATCHLRLL